MTAKEFIETDGAQLLQEQDLYAMKIDKYETTVTFNDPIFLGIRFERITGVFYNEYTVTIVCHFSYFIFWRHVKHVHFAVS